jgi:hypothetical protein
MAGKRKKNFTGAMTHLYVYVGKRRTTYYSIISNQRTNLGHDLNEARRKLVELTAPQLAEGTVGHLIDERLAEFKRLVESGKRAQRTLDEYIRDAEILKEVFGRMRPAEVTRRHLLKYLFETRGREAPVRANREIALLSTAFEWARRRGDLENNPCAGIGKNEEVPRDRLVEADELRSFLDFARRRGGASAKLAAVAELSSLTAKAQGQLLTMTKSQLTTEGLAFTRRLRGTRKRGRSTLVEWSPRLRALVDELQAFPGAKDSIYVLANHFGKPYTSSGFKALWNVAMHKWVDEGRPRLADGQPDRDKPSTRAAFTFHDLRAVAITRAKEQGRDAAPLSGHTTEQMATKVYDRRRIVRAKPVE